MALAPSHCTTVRASSTLSHSVFCWCSLKSASCRTQSRSCGTPSGPRAREGAGSRACRQAPHSSLCKPAPRTPPGTPAQPQSTCRTVQGSAFAETLVMQNGRRNGTATQCSAANLSHRRLNNTRVFVITRLYACTVMSSTVSVTGIMHSYKNRRWLLVTKHACWQLECAYMIGLCTSAGFLRTDKI